MVRMKKRHNDCPTTKNGIENDDVYEKRKN